MNKVQEILEEILVTNDLSIWQLSKKLKVPYMTVYHWIKHAQNSKVGIC
jgi:transposase